VKPAGWRRALTGPLARRLVLAALLLPPWPALGHVYGRYVAWLFATVTEAANPSVTLTVDGAAPNGSAWKLPLHAEDTVTGAYLTTTLDLRRSAYLASAIFLVLALSTALPRRNKAKAALLAGGLLPLQLLPLLPLFFFFSGPLRVHAFQLSGFSRWVVDVAYHALVAPLGMAYAVPVLLWLLLVWALGGDPGVRLPAFLRAAFEPGPRATAPDKARAP
jgi:hypothetical protein